jgi:hypothetical protein
MRSAGPLLVAGGIVLIIVGALAWSGGLSWFGRLPGDLRIERESVRIYVPILDAARLRGAEPGALPAAALTPSVS